MIVMWEKVLKEMSEEDTRYYQTFFNALAEMTEDKLSGNVKDIFEELVRVYDDYENDCSAVENIYNGALKFINDFKIQNLLMPYMGSQVIRPMVETDKEEYDSEWQETLKAIDIKNRAKSLQNHNYIFDHDEDPRIPKQNPTRTAGGYPKLWFIERAPDRQHPQEPHYAEIKGKKKDDFTALTHYLKNRLPAITLENDREQGTRDITSSDSIKEKKRAKKKDYFYSKLKNPEQAEAAYMKWLHKNPHMG